MRTLRSFVIQAWIDYECSTSIAKFTPVTTLYIWLNKICDGGSSKETFLKATTLSILIWAYPREIRTSSGNFKNAAILPSKIAHAWPACALILPLCHPLRDKNLFSPFDLKIFQSVQSFVVLILWWDRKSVLRTVLLCCDYIEET